MQPRLVKPSQVLQREGPWCRSTGYMRQGAADPGPSTQVTFLVMPPTLQRDPPRPGICDSTKSAFCPCPPSNRSGY